MTKRRCANSIIKYSVKSISQEVFVGRLLGRLGLNLPVSFWRRLETVFHRLFPATSVKGRPRHDWHLVVGAVLYRLRSGCQWRALPREFGPTSTLHGWFQKLNRSRIWHQLWRAARSEFCDFAGPLLIDASLIKAPLGGDLTGPSPVHRSRLGSKRSILTDSQGLPVAIVLAEANRHDSKLVTATLDACMVPLAHKIIVGDKGYRGKAVAIAVTAKGALIELPNSLSPSKAGQKLRWRIERTLAWFNNWRGLATRYERRADNHLAMLHLWAYLTTLQAQK